MAKIIVEYDTELKTMSVKKDSMELTDINRLEFFDYYMGEDKKQYGMVLKFNMINNEDGTVEEREIYASDIAVNLMLKAR